MKKSLLILSITLLVTLMGSQVMGQQLTATNSLSLGMPEVLKVASNSTTISLVLTAQAAGLAVLDTVTNSTARILISSVISTTNTHTLSASVTNGTVPDGTYLKLIALAPNGNFIGTQGSLGSEIPLTDDTDQSIVTLIGTCYSGIAADDGYKLKYTFGIPATTTDYGLIRASGGTSITVTLTISATI